MKRYYLVMLQVYKHMVAAKIDFRGRLKLVNILEKCLGGNKTSIKTYTYITDRFSELSTTYMYYESDQDQMQATTKVITRPERCGRACMQTIAKRLNTFMTWQCTRIWPKHLAEAGFFRTGETTVQCYKCGIILDTDYFQTFPKNIHKLVSPECTFSVALEKGEQI